MLCVRFCVLYVVRYWLVVVDACCLFVFCARCVLFVCCLLFGYWRFVIGVLRVVLVRCCLLLVVVCCLLYIRCMWIVCLLVGVSSSCVVVLFVFSCLLLCVYLVRFGLTVVFVVSVSFILCVCLFVVFVAHCVDAGCY